MICLHCCAQGSRETHCPNGASDCPGGQFCWTNVACDVREFIPFEEGGFLGKPEPVPGVSDKELALSLGFTWPSLKVGFVNSTRVCTSLLNLNVHILFLLNQESDHYFCGSSLNDANNLCDIPCPDGEWSQLASYYLLLEFYKSRQLHASSNTTLIMQEMHWLAITANFAFRTRNAMPEYTLNITLHRHLLLFRLQPRLIMTIK